MTSPTAYPLRAAVAAFAAERYPAVSVTARDSLSMIWARLRAAGVATPGDEFVDWVEIGVIGGVFLPLVTNCADLGAAIHALARYHPLIDDNAAIQLIEQPGNALDVTIVAADGGSPDPDSLHTFSKLLEHLTVRLVGPGSVPTGIENGLRFGPELMAKPIRSADPRIAALLAPMAESDLTDRKSTLIATVRSTIRASGLRPPPPLAEVARRLACSTRSLQQQLADSGTSYSSLLDDERRTLALSLLADPDRTITSTAFATGFGSVEGFGRAMRRWTGLTPTAWRRNHSVDES